MGMVYSLVLSYRMFKEKERRHKFCTTSRATPINNKSKKEVVDNKNI